MHPPPQQAYRAVIVIAVCTLWCVTAAEIVGTVSRDGVVDIPERPPEQSAHAARSPDVEAKLQEAVDRERELFEAGHAKPFTPENGKIFEETDLPHPSTMMCGTAVRYWSTSCGPILSADSRHCSSGGDLVNPSACSTHFSAHCRGCGFGYLGCQSLCEKRALPCRPGHISFASRHYKVASTTEKLQVLIKRVGGYDKDQSVRVIECGEGQTGELDGQGEGSARDLKFIIPETVTFAHGDRNPQVVSLLLNRRYAELALHKHTHRRIRIHLCLEHSSTISNETASLYPLISTVVDINSPPDEVAFEHAHYHGQEGDVVSITVNRVGNGLGDASVEVHHVGGSAHFPADFVAVNSTFPIVLRWNSELEGPSVSCAGNAYDCQQPRSFQIQVRVSDMPEQEETIVLALENHHHLYIGDRPQIATIHIKESNNSVEWDEAAVRRVLLTKLKILTDVALDSHTREYFLSAFEQIVLPAGTVISRQGSRDAEVYFIESGQVEIWSNKYNHLGTSRNTGTTPRLAHVASEGTMFGILSCLENVPRLATYVAATDVRLWVVDQATVQSLISHNPNVKFEMEKLAVKQIAQASTEKPPLFLFPGFMSTRLVAWKKKSCVGLDINVLDAVWFSTEKLLQTLISDSQCWLQCLELQVNQTDPADCILRPMDGIASISELETGLLLTGPTTIFRRTMEYFATEYKYTLIHLLAAPYDWRLSMDMIETRDKYFTKLKVSIENQVRSCGSAGMAIAHSQGNNVFLQFMRYLEHHYPDTWEQWVEDHIHSYFGLGAPLLGTLDPAYGVLTKQTLGLPISGDQAISMFLSFGTMSLFLPNEPDRYSPRWPAELFVVKHLNGSKSVFSAVNFTNGDYYTYLGRATNDSRFLRQYDTLYEHYINQPFEHLASGYKRPPVKHVNMMYGRNVPTPIAVYAHEEATASEGVLKLVVDSVALETKGGVIVDKVTGKVLGHTGNEVAGDITVPYASLSWSSTWHDGETVTEHVPQKLIEFYENPVGRWGENTVLSVMNTVEPEYSRTCSGTKGANPHYTCVYEIEGVPHREIVKSDFTQKLIGEALVQIFKDSITKALN